MNLSRRGLWHRDRPSRAKWLIPALIAGVLVVPPLWLAWPVLGDPSAGFAQRRGDVATADVTRRWQADNSDYQQLTLRASSGLQVELTVRRPQNVDEPRPLVILLGGYGTGRDAAELVRDPGGMVIASLSYPYHGTTDFAGLDLLWNLDDIQQAVLDTPPAVMLTLEYLARQSYVDTGQIELVGVSFGAFFVSVPGALDDRFSRVWLIQGAADPQAIYKYRLRDRIRFEPLRALVARVLGFVTAADYLKPERWVGKISPRPVMVINSRGDTAYPPASVARLHASLREPYELQWLTGEHITPGREEVLQQLNEQVIRRIVAYDDSKSEN